LREDQACATALILACSTSVQDSQVADWAARSLFIHGGEVKVAPISTVASPASPYMSSPGMAPGLINTPGNMQQVNINLNIISILI